MKILNEKPPIWEEAHKHFDIVDEATFFTYGDTIYNPAGIPIDEDLMAHEETHSRQQAAFEGGPAAWWKRYFVDVAFRAEQEAQAHGQQYRHFCARQKDRNVRNRYLLQIAGFLASGMYKVGMSGPDAMAAIKKRAEKFV